MKRLFLAIRINPDPKFLETITRLRYSLSGEKIKWVEEKNIHITIKFLGETDERLIADIRRVSGKIAELTDDFQFQLSELGIFGSSYKPRVIWVGINPHDKLAELMKKASLEFESIGYRAGRQNLVPHLTLGRIKAIQDKILFQKAIDKFKGLSSQTLSAKCLNLYESILRPAGPEYISIESFPLNK